VKNFKIRNFFQEAAVLHLKSDFFLTSSDSRYIIFDFKRIHRALLHLLQVTPLQAMLVESQADLCCASADASAVNNAGFSDAIQQSENELERAPLFQQQGTLSAARPTLTRGEGNSIRFLSMNS
jgi:hypothetical protein